MPCTKPVVTDATAAIRTAEPKILPCPEEAVTDVSDAIRIAEPDILPCPEPGAVVNDANDTIRIAEPEIARCSPVMIVEDVEAHGRTDESYRPHEPTSQWPVLSFAAACGYMYFFFIMWFIVINNYYYKHV